MVVVVVEVRGESQRINGGKRRMEDVPRRSAAMGPETKLVQGDHLTW